MKEMMAAAKAEKEAKMKEKNEEGRAGVIKNREECTGVRKQAMTEFMAEMKDIADAREQDYLAGKEPEEKVPDDVLDRTPEE